MPDMDQFPDNQDCDRLATFLRESVDRFMARLDIKERASNTHEDRVHYEEWVRFCLVTSAGPRCPGRGLCGLRIRRRSPQLQDAGPAGTRSDSSPGGHCLHRRCDVRVARPPADEDRRREPAPGPGDPHSGGRGAGVVRRCPLSDSGHRRPAHRGLTGVCMGCFQLWDDRSSSAQPTGRAVVQEVTRPFLPLVWYRKGARKSFPFQVHNIYTYPCQPIEGDWWLPPETQRSGLHGL